MNCVLLTTGFTRQTLPWRWSCEVTKRNPTPLYFCAWRIKVTVNHEEVLSRPASRCACRAAALSGLLRHQMAVSIHSPQLHSTSSHDVMKRRNVVWRFYARGGLLWGEAPVAALKWAPTFLKLILMRGKAWMFSRGVCHERESRLNGQFLWPWLETSFNNLDAASVNKRAKLTLKLSDEIYHGV